MRRKDIGIIHYLNQRRKVPLSEKLQQYKYEAQTLSEIQQNITRTVEEQVQRKLSKITNEQIRNTLTRRYKEYKRWTKSRATLDQKRAQRDYLELADLIYKAIPDDGYVDLQELAWQLKIPSKKLLSINRYLGKE